MTTHPLESTSPAPDDPNAAAPDAEEGCFYQRYPAYAATRALDQLRQDEYSRLDRLGQVYLDYTGGGLYSDQQVKSHQDLLLTHVYGNPHSSNPTSRAMTCLVESARAYVLEFFNASPQEYVCIFTLNASGALKLVGESYPFGPGGHYLLTFDNHNSVNGIREFARARGASILYAPTPPPEMRMDAERLEAYLDLAAPGANHLFAYPAQSNFSGVQHSLDWIERAQQKGWDVLLDAAAFVPTNRLDLGVVHPDFVSLSFYKMFGYPTGVGALLARRSALAKLHRPWFAGGTITVASVQGDRYFLHGGAEGFEDGTLNYLTLPAVEIGLRHIARIGQSVIHSRVTCLTGWLLEQLSALRHSNGLPVLKIYGPLDTQQRGGTITLNFFDPRGHFVDHLRVEERANQHNISLRTGCFCNPGGGELALGLSAGELNTCFALKPRMEYQDFRRCIDDKSTGAVRISVGLVSNFADAQTLVQFARTLVDVPSDQV
jgi:selenocysteine lyase/cysteine desulfurase